MCSLYLFIRQLPKAKYLFERKLWTLVPVSSHLAITRNIQSCSSVHIYTLKIFSPYMSAVRSFAKDKVKSKKGPSRIPINEQELSEVFDVEKLYSDFQMPIDYLKKIYVEQLGLRTSAASVNEIKVKYDGETYTIQDLAEIGMKSTREILLEMGNFPDAIPNVLESLKNSALNVNPSRDGTLIVIPIPKVTMEHRESLAKKAKLFLNNCKDSIKNIQNKNIKLITDKNNLSEDTVFRLKSQLTSIAQIYIAQAEEIFKMKQKELLSPE